MDLKAFISKHDMLWSDFPRKWDEGPFLGNGRLGLLCYFEGDSLLFPLGSTDVYDNRPFDPLNSNIQFQTPRLPIGSFELKTVGKPTGFSAKLSLYDAAVSGVVTTELGSTTFSARIPYDGDVWQIETADSGKERSRLLYVPDKAESPRQTKMREFKDWKRYCSTYQEPKAPRDSSVDGVSLHIQPLFSEGAYVVGWKSEHGRLTAAISLSGESDAASKVLSAAAGFGELAAAHALAWSSYWQGGFISLPDAVLEDFYWIQLYKIACLSRPDGRVTDTVGPWLMPTSWPAAFWNLNVQLIYSSMYVPGKFAQASALPNNLISETDTLIDNVEPQYRSDSAGICLNTTSSLYSPMFVPGRDMAGKVELGNLTWVLFCVWRQYEFTGELRLVRDAVLPLLRRCIGYYRHFLFERDGYLHLMPTESPEYCTIDEDTNYDLALIRWALQTLPKACALCGEEPDGDWSDIERRLVPYPENESEGFQISANVRMSHSHRHYSHLLMFYPLRLLSPDSPADRARVIKTIEHWQSMPEMLEGYSQTGAASMYALLGDGDKALEYLKKLVSGFVRPNTMYREEGGPVTETPLAAVTSLCDMLIQTDSDTLKIFPAVPSGWKDVCFYRLCAFGGLRVSARLAGGKLAWLDIRASRDVSFRLVCDACDRIISLKAGMSFTLPCDAAAEPQDVCSEESMHNCFGLNDKTARCVKLISPIDTKKTRPTVDPATVTVI